MTFPHPRIITSTLEKATAEGCDCVMLKHDGFPVVINCAARACNVFTDFHVGAREVVESFTIADPLDALLVGAKSRSRPTIWLYDVWWLNGHDVQYLSYRERYILLRTNTRSLDERFKPVTVHPISAAADLWQQVVADPVNLKGLVFRRSKDNSVGDLFVRRYYVTAPEGLT